MSDDMLRDAIETSRRILGAISDFDTEGLNLNNDKSSQ
jgi:hypothetical protein